MLRILQKFILTTLFAVFASQASAMFIQPDWFDPTQPGVGTNRYSYSFNDPINSWDPNGNACGGACSEEDQARIDEAEPVPLFDETAASIEAEIERLQNEIAGLPANQAPTTGCNSPRDCGATPGQSPITQGDLLMLEMNALVGLRSVVPANTTEAGMMGIGLGMGRVGVVPGKPLGYGDLLPGEINAIQGVVDQAGRPLSVVGSAARAARKPGSDIDYVVSPGSLERYRGLDNRLPGIDPSHGIVPGYPNPNQGPFITFKPRGPGTFP